MSSLIVRQAETYDALDIHSLLHEGLQRWSGNEYDNIREWFDTNYHIDFVLQHIVNNRLLVLVDDEDIILGTLIVEFFYHDNIPYVYFKGLHSKTKGGGQLLLNAGVSVSKSLGAEYIVCDVWENNIYARSFIERYGFTAYNYETFQSKIEVTYFKYLLQIK
jgi:ribosomal protein S18 acetylase RimI-like enzyme